MKIGTENIPTQPERKALRESPESFRGSNLETSVISSLGITFGEAEQKTKPPDGCADEEWDVAADTAEDIHRTEPATLGDALVKLRVLASPLGVLGGSSSSHAVSIAQISAFLTPSIAD